MPSVLVVLRGDFLRKPDSLITPKRVRTQLSSEEQDSTNASIREHCVDCLTKAGYDVTLVCCTSSFEPVELRNQWLGAMGDVKKLIDMGGLPKSNTQVNTIRSIWANTKQFWRSADFTLFLRRYFSTIGAMSDDSSSIPQASTSTAYEPTVTTQPSISSNKFPNSVERGILFPLNLRWRAIRRTQSCPNLKGKADCF